MTSSVGQSAGVIYSEETGIGATSSTGQGGRAMSSTKPGSGITSPMHHGRRATSRMAVWHPLLSQVADSRHQQSQEIEQPRRKVVPAQLEGPFLKYFLREYIRSSHSQVALIRDPIPSFSNLSQFYSNRASWTLKKNLLNTFYKVLHSVRQCRVDADASAVWSMKLNKVYRQNRKQELWTCGKVQIQRNKQETKYKWQEALHCTERQTQNQCSSKHDYIYTHKC